MRTFGKVRLVRGKWLIECEPHVMIRLKRTFEKMHRMPDGAAVLEDTPENARELEWFLERFPMVVDEDMVYLGSRAEQHRRLADEVASITANGFVPREFALAIPAREYQRIAAELAARTGRLLCADDLGLGKTVTAICALADIRRRPALVVTMTHLPRQWERELARFLPAASVHILKKGEPYPIDPWPDVVISNYHKLNRWADVLKGQVKSVVFDEVQELRRAGSDKYQAAQRIAIAAEMRIGLSGTPIYNYGGEMHAIMDVLAPDALGSWNEFAREWCSDYADRTKAVVKEPRALGTFLREQGLMLRRTKADVGRELPPFTKVPHTIDVDVEEINKIAGPAMDLARLILKQGGMERGEKMRASEELTWRLRQATGLAKAVFVADFVRLLVENGERVLLVGWHHEVYKIWCERLADLKPVKYTGEESTKQKDAAKAAFVSGDSQVLVMSLRAGAGLDGLQDVCTTVVHGELDWSPQVHDQVDGRVYRDGQTKPVFAYYLVADSGSDPVVADVLGLKRSQSDGVRDPTADLIAASQTDPARVRRLAEEYIRQRGGHVPKAAKALPAHGTTADLFEEAAQ